MGVCPVLKCSLDSWEQFFCLNGKQVGPPPLLVLIILPNLQCTSACHQSYRLLGRVPRKRQGISPWYKPCTNRNCRGVWHSHSDHQSGVPSHIHRTPSWNSSWNPSWNPSSLYPVQVGKVALEVHVRNNRWLLCKPMNAGFQQKGFQMGSTHKGFYHSIEERTGGNIHGMNPAGYHRVLPIVTGNQSNDISIWGGVSIENSLSLVFFA